MEPQLYLPDFSKKKRSDLIWRKKHLCISCQKLKAILSKFLKMRFLCHISFIRYLLSQTWYLRIKSNSFCQPKLKAINLRSWELKFSAFFVKKKKTRVDWFWFYATYILYTSITDENIKVVRGSQPRTDCAGLGDALMRGPYEPHSYMTETPAAHMGNTGGHLVHTS